VSVTGARGPIQFLKMSKERPRLQLRDGIFEHDLSVQQRLQKTKNFMFVTGRACARASPANGWSNFIVLYCILKSTASAPGWAIRNCSTTYTFWAIHVWRWEKVARYHKKSSFGYFAASVQYFFIFFYLVTCKIKRSVIYFKRI